MNRRNFLKLFAKVGVASGFLATIPQVSFSNEKIQEVSGYYFNDKGTKLYVLNELGKPKLLFNLNQPFEISTRFV